jgi:hypothetical protein
MLLVDYLEARGRLKREIVRVFEKNNVQNRPKLDKLKAITFSMQRGGISRVFW